MKISLKWLNDFIEVNEYFKSPQVLSDLLTKAGLEVEEMQDRSRDLQKVVIGEILVKDKHPNADKLSLCQVKVSRKDSLDQILQIVCGAQNHKALDRVIVALPGAVLPGNFAIKKSAIRGIESSGMLCSKKELGLAKESDGLFILPPTAPVGEDYSIYAGLDDIIFELKVTPNRADCLSHYGLAREISCILGRPLKRLQPEFSESPSATRQRIQLKVHDHQLCPRYCGRSLQNIKVGESPQWLKTRIESVGLNSINNVVDVTNYVMMELGQPLHAFDAKYLEGQTVHVQKAKAQEKFKTLQETEITLLGEELMICDGQKAVALAGVIGGLNSGVSDSTTEIFLESANFMAMSVRKSARRHGVETDSAYRFSRGVDPSSTKLALDRATELILQVAGGEALCEAYDIYPSPMKKSPIHIALRTISERLGYEAMADRFVGYMKGLGCEIKELSGATHHPTYEVLPPSFRFDLETDMDLVEEYARLFGYEHITETIPSFSQAPSTHDRAYVLNLHLGQRLRAEGFSQAFNFAFVGREPQMKFLGASEGLRATGLIATSMTGSHANAKDDDEIAILNPLNEDLNVMRKTLSFGLFQNAGQNIRQGNSLGRLFEIGKVFSRAETGAYCETTHLAMMAWGQSQQLWQPTPQHNLIFELKAAFENLMQDFKIKSYSFVQQQGLAPSFAHPSQCAVLNVEGKKIGFISTAHPSLLDKEKMRVPVAFLEVDLEKLLQGQPRPLRAKSLAKFPAVERDFSFVMEKSLAVGEVQKEIQKICGSQLLKKIEVFDLYSGDKLDAQKKSVSFRLRLQSDDGTLQDEQIQELSNKILQGLEKQFSLTIR